MGWQHRAVAILVAEEMNLITRKKADFRTKCSRVAASCLAQGEAEGEPWATGSRHIKPRQGRLEPAGRNHPPSAHFQDAPGGASLSNTLYPGLARPNGLATPGAKKGAPAGAFCQKLFSICSMGNL